MDDLAVAPCEVLADLDVMQIVLQIATIEEDEVGRNLRRLCLELSVQRLDRLLQFTAPPLRLVAADEFVTHTEELVFSVCVSSMAMFW